MLERMLLEDEYVRPVEAYPDYFITSRGRVISGKKKRKQRTLDGTIYEVTLYKTLKTFNTGGYDRVTLVKSGVKHNIYVHELVLSNFVGLTDKTKLKIKHIDGDKSNNNLENLEYVLRKTTTLRR